MRDALGDSGSPAGAKMLARLIRQQAETLTLADTRRVMARDLIDGLLLIPLLSKPRTASAKSDAGAHSGSGAGSITERVGKVAAAVLTAIVQQAVFGGHKRCWV